MKTPFRRTLPLLATLWLLLLFSVGVPVVNSDVVSDQVYEITDANLDVLIADDTEWLLMIYANWCGHCRQFKPELERLPALINKAGLSARVGRVNIDENPGIASRFLVAYLPTIFHIKNRQVRTLDFSLAEVRALGGRSADTLLQFVQQQTWQSIHEWHWLFSPWALIPRAMGLLSQLVALLHYAVKSIGQLHPMLSEDRLVLALVLASLGTLIALSWSILRSSKKSSASSASQRTTAKKRD